MPQDAAFQLLRDAIFLGILVLGYRKAWIFYFIHEEILQALKERFLEMKADRDNWRTLALQALGQAKAATTLGHQVVDTVAAVVAPQASGPPQFTGAGFPGSSSSIPPMPQQGTYPPSYPPPQSGPPLGAPPGGPTQPPYPLPPRP